MSGRDDDEDEGHDHADHTVEIEVEVEVPVEVIVHEHHDHFVEVEVPVHEHHDHFVEVEVEVPGPVKIVYVEVEGPGSVEYVAVTETVLVDVEPSGVLDQPDVVAGTVLGTAVAYTAVWQIVRKALLKRARLKAAEVWDDLK